MPRRTSDILRPGSKLHDRYEIVRLIGQGGLGSVYLCEDLKLPGTQWAVKALKSSDSSSNKEAFLREARFLAALRHQCMPIIVDVFSQGDFQYLVMEYVDGQTLADKIERDGPPTADQALQWSLDLARVLHYLHSQERPVVFRDLKPENVMLTREGSLKVIDFGLARHFEMGKTKDTQASGTVGYTPPEQWEDNEQTDPRSDIYALGATLYYFLTGKPPSPIYGKSTLTDQGSRLAPEVQEFVEKCLSVAPSDRFDSASEVVTRLSQLVEIQKRFSPFKSGPAGREPLRSPLSSSNRFLKVLTAGIVLFTMGLLLPPIARQVSASNPNQPLTLLVDELRQTADQKDEIRELLSQGKHKEAIARLDSLVTLHPQDAEAHILKNNAYAELSSSLLYRIPVVTSLKGDEREGFQALFGWALAQSDINRDRAAGLPLVYLELNDDRSDSARLLDIVGELAKDPNTPLVLGPWTSQQSLLVSPLVNDGGLPLITSVAADPRVLSSGPNIFCIADTDINKSRVLADHFKAIGCRKAAVFADRSRYVSRTVAGLFSERFEEMGGDIVLQDAYPSDTIDFSSAIKKAKKRGADCIFLSEYRMAPVISFCQTKADLGWDVPIATQVAGFGGELPEQGGKPVDGMFLASTYVPSYLNEQQENFQSRFRTMFGKREATHREAQVYDSLRLAVDALDAVGADREKLQAYLTQIGRSSPPYEGISGTFAPSKRLNAREAYVVEVRDGGFHLVREPGSTLEE